MSAAQHTPGPWLRDGRTVYALNVEGYNHFYAQVHGPHTSTAELEAIATVMAAAPELLAHLRIVAFHLRRGDFAERSNLAHEALAKIDAAIAKATGAAA